MAVFQDLEDAHILLILDQEKGYSGRIIECGGWGC
jgi:hypothetical protein